MKTLSTLLLLAAALLQGRAQSITYLRMSNTVEQTTLSNADRIVLYRSGTNPPATIRGSNLHAAFVPAAMSNAWLTSLAGAQPTNANLTDWSAVPTNRLAVVSLVGHGSTFVTNNGGVWTINHVDNDSGANSQGMFPVYSPVNGDMVPAGGPWLFINEPFKTWGAAAWPAQTPLVISGLSAYSYRPIWRPDTQQERGGLWLWVTNWPGRITYFYYAQNTTASGSGSLILRTNSWIDVRFWTMVGGATTAITNCEMIVGLLDAPGLSAGAMPREGAFFIARPAGSGPLTDWAAVVMKGNAMVSSNRLGWGPSTNEWQRLTIAGSSNSLTFYTNGQAAVTVSSLSFQTNALFPVPMYLRTVVTNTGYSFASNSVWIDWLQVKE